MQKEYCKRCKEDVVTIISYSKKLDLPYRKRSILIECANCYAVLFSGIVEEN